MHITKNGRYPDFLVIGAMKSGTTTLYNELSSHSDVSLPDKELNFFVSDSCRESDMVNKYLSAFPANGVTGDVSTTYTMLPTHQNTAENAYAILSESTRLLYIVRNPIERAISHHHHLQARGAFSGSFEKAINEYPEILEYGRYEVQVAPWTQRFGSDSLLIIQLEALASNPDVTRNRIAQHLGLELSGFSGRSAQHSNKTESAKVLRGIGRTVMESSILKYVYRDRLRAIIPVPVKRIAKNLLLPKPPKRGAPPKNESLMAMLDLYRPTDQFISTAIGGSLWNLDETVKNIIDSNTAR